MRIYIATSWKNQHTTGVVKALRELGHEVYDFRENEAFSWQSVGVDPEELATLDENLVASRHPMAINGFQRDMTQLESCDALVLLLPAGNSAHLEAGWASAAGKPVIVHAPEKYRPELMHKMFDDFTGTTECLVEAITTASDMLRGGP